MKYLSVFSGIEAASVAWEPLGFQAVGFGEVDSFASAVLKKRFPNTPNYGDITKYAEWPIEPGTIDILVGGSPCQAFSIAGLRKGLADPRGNLALTFLGLADKIKPRWIVWENVPGVLSSNGGNDFSSFIGALAQFGYGYAWRCLDAQYFGVPQRRKRVFLVATSTGNSALAAEVLSIREGLLRDSEESNQQGQEAASTPGEGSEGDDRQQRFAFGGNNTAGPISVAACLSANSSPSGRMDFASETFIAEPKHVVIDRSAYNQGKNAKFGTHIGEADVMDALIARGPHAIGIPYVKAKRARSETDYESWKNTGTSNTINVFDSGDVRTTHAIVHVSEFRLRGTFTPHDVCSTLKANAKSGDSEPLVIESQEMHVRRLTPIECERLQGFPDNWTRIEWRGKSEENCPDGLRYKACGNSMAVPVMRFIGKQLLKHNGSLSS